MARKRKVVEANYPEMIENLKAEIEELNQTIKDSKASLSEKKKELSKTEKDYEAYTIAREKEEKEKEVNDFIQDLLASGMTVTEMKEHLLKNEKKPVSVKANKSDEKSNEK